jgi:hypothetical protein
MPANVSEAEARGDVKWLVANGSPEAVAALGRLADKNPKALEAVDSRTSFDTNAFIAAWTATVRGAAWGPATIKKGLADPTRAEVTASAMGRGDPHLVGFVTDLEGALSRLSASLQNISIATTLASAGPPAHPVIVRRLADAATRGAMCRGIASSDASADAKKTLTQVPVESRDDRWCVDAAIHVAADDDDAATWLAKTAEPGLLIAAGTDDSMPCAKLHTIWSKAIAERPAALYSALIVPLGDAIKRCPQEMDGVLADAITRLPASHPLVVMAIDPFSDNTNGLKATCAALAKVGSSGRDSGRVREHAMDTLAGGCRH